MLHVRYTKSWEREIKIDWKMEEEISIKWQQVWMWIWCRKRAHFVCWRLTSHTRVNKLMLITNDTLKTIIMLLVVPSAFAMTTIFFFCFPWMRDIPGHIKNSQMVQHGKLCKWYCFNLIKSTKDMQFSRWSICWSWKKNHGTKKNILIKRAR